MSVAIKKIPGVEKVEASLNKGKAFIQLKPGNTVKLEELVQKVRDNAFHPKEAKVTARGELISAGGKLRLKVAANEIYELVPDARAPANAEELKKNAGKILLVEGVIPAPKEKIVSRIIFIQSFQLAS